MIEKIAVRSICEVKYNDEASKTYMHDNREFLSAYLLKYACLKSKCKKILSIKTNGKNDKFIRLRSVNIEDRSSGTAIEQKQIATTYHIACMADTTHMLGLSEHISHKFIAYISLDFSRLCLLVFLLS